MSTIDLGMRLWAWNYDKSKENGAVLPTINAVVLRESRDLLEGRTWIGHRYLIPGLDEKGKIMKVHRKGWLL